MGIRYGGEGAVRLPKILVLTWCVSVMVSSVPPVAGSALSECDVRLQCRGPIACSKPAGSPLAGAGVPPAHPAKSARGGAGASSHARNGPRPNVGGGPLGAKGGQPMGLSLSEQERQRLRQPGTAACERTSFWTSFRPLLLLPWPTGCT